MIRPLRTQRALIVGAGALVCAAAASPLVAQVTERPVAQQTVLAAAPAAGAPGTTLSLSQVTIPPGAVLDAHRHAGTQIATIDAGRLTYTVHTSGVRVFRPGRAGAPRLVRTIRRGQTAVLTPGTTIVEPPNAVHEARNRGRVAVALTLTTLVPKGAPPSIAMPGF